MFITFWWKCYSKDSKDSSSSIYRVGRLASLYFLFSNYYCSSLCCCLGVELFTIAKGEKMSLSIVIQKRNKTRNINSIKNKEKNRSYEEKSSLKQK
jgi:hypothetical protein